MEDESANLFANENAVYLEAPSLVETERPKERNKHWSCSSCSEDSTSCIGVESAEPLLTAPSVDFSETIDSENGVQDYVNSLIGKLEKKLEYVLDSITDELNSEVNLERQHLVLMQEKVDNQGQTLQKEFNELHKKMTQETTIRAMVQQKHREEKEAIDSTLKTIAKDLSELKSKVNQIHEPWMYRTFYGVFNLFSHCSSGVCPYENVPSGQS
eukprot:g6768.t1